MVETMAIYVDIESLLDLRQGFLVCNGKTYDEVLEYISSDEYNNRNIDNLMEFTSAQYIEHVKSGDINLVVESIITNIHFDINKSIDRIIMKSNHDNALYTPEILFDIGNFDFTKEQEDMLINLLFIKTGERSKITLVRNYVDKMSPVFIRDNNIAFVYIYRASTWLNKHGAKLMDTSLEKTEFYFAPIYEKNEEAELNVFEEAGFRDGFTFYEFGLSRFTKVRFNPCLFYSNCVIATELQKDLLAQLRKETVDLGEIKDSEIEELLDGCLSW